VSDAGPGFSVPGEATISIRNPTLLPDAACPAAPTRLFAYDAFVSYSHAKDKPILAALQSCRRS
jgi:hypothetical protein